MVCEEGNDKFGNEGTESSRTDELFADSSSNGDVESVVITQSHIQK